MCAAVARLPLSFPGVVEEDAEVQVQLFDGTGLWHRWLAGSGLNHMTACGLLASSRATLDIRHNSYRGRICDVCFTPKELEESSLINERDERERREWVDLATSRKS